MAFKTFAPGVLTSSDVNTFLMRQAVITCTSSTRPASPSEGMTIYETDTDAHRVYDGTNWQRVIEYGAWTSFTPNPASAWTLGNAVHDCRYTLIGRLCVVHFELEVGSTTSFPTSPSVMHVDLPVTAAGKQQPKMMMGITYLFDDSLANPHFGFFNMLDSTSFEISGTLQLGGGQVVQGGLDVNRPFTWAADDYISGTFLYEVAS